jgi:hypothetical protein
MRHPSPADWAIRNNRHDSHHAKVHHPDDQEDRHRTGTAVAAVESEAQAVSPGRAGVGRQRTATAGCLAAAGQVTRFPRAELERPADEDDHADRERYSSCQRRLPHLVLAGIVLRNVRRDPKPDESTPKRHERSHVGGDHKLEGAFS